MATPVYPSSLPGVCKFNGEPVPQSIATPDAMAVAYRRRSRVPGSSVNVGWKYLESDYKVFRTWWESELLNGHKWFAMQLPSAAGIVNHIVRFGDQHYDAKMNGHRFWEVTAQLEIRERAFRPEGDPYWSSVVLLLPFDSDRIDVSQTGGLFNADGSVGYMDSGVFGQQVNLNGISISNPSGSSTNIIYSAAFLPAWGLESGDWCIELWITLQSTPNSVKTLIKLNSTGGGSPGQVGIFADISGSGGVRFYAIVPSNPSSGITLGSADRSVYPVRTHLALTRAGNTYRFFADGEIVATQSSSYRHSPGNTGIFIGNTGRFQVSALDGQIDDIRLTKGVARYTSAFTPPTKSHPRSV